MSLFSKPIKIRVVLYDDIFEPYGEHGKSVMFLYKEALGKRLRETFLFAEIEITSSPDHRQAGHVVEGTESDHLNDHYQSLVEAIDSDLWQQLLEL